MIVWGEVGLGRGFPHALPQAPGTLPTLAFTDSGCGFPWSESTSPPPLSWPRRWMLPSAASPPLRSERWQVHAESHLPDSLSELGQPGKEVMGLGSSLNWSQGPWRGQGRGPEVLLPWRRSHGSSRSVGGWHSAVYTSPGAPGASRAVPVPTPPGTRREIIN